MMKQLDVTGLLMDGDHWTGLEYVLIMLMEWWNKIGTSLKVIDKIGRLDQTRLEVMDNKVRKISWWFIIIKYSFKGGSFCPVGFYMFKVSFTVLI